MEYEANMRRDSAGRPLRVEDHEFAERSKKGSLVFQSPCKVHDTSEPLFERRHVNELGIRNFFGPAVEQVGASLRDSRLVGPVQELKPHPDRCVN